MQTIGLKTARVEFIRNSEHGSLWFHEGRAVHASVPGCSEGEASFFELLDWNDGSFRIEHGQTSPAITIDKDPTFLLMEGLRRLDEQRMGISDASDEAAAG